MDHQDCTRHVQLYLSSHRESRIIGGPRSPALFGRSQTMAARSDGDRRSRPRTRRALCDALAQLWSAVRSRWDCAPIQLPAQACVLHSRQQAAPAQTFAKSRSASPWSGAASTLNYGRHGLTMIARRLTRLSRSNTRHHSSKTQTDPRPWHIETLPPYCRSTCALRCDPLRHI